MRKFLLIAMVLFALPTFAQNYNMRLANIFSEDGFEAWDYVYSSEKGTNLVCINEVEFVTPANEFIDSIFYDERGNIKRLATWQKYYGENPNIPYGEWIYACYVEYEYDENNNKTSRKNYNDFYDGYGFQLGGTYRYYYDEEGRMTEWAMEFMDIEDWQKGIIEYDEEGRKVSEEIRQFSKETYFHEPQFLTEYKYDANGNLERVNEFVWDAEMWSVQAFKIREFDEYGNCLKTEQTTAAGTVQERKVFEYDTNVSAENIYYYPNPEEDFPQLPEVKKHLLKSFEFWAQNDNMDLVLVTTYLLDYAVVEDDAVEEVAFASSVYPNPAQDYVMVESSEADYVEVVDVYGRVLFATEMSEAVKVDMSEFASGIYFVKLQANGATSVQKIMKK